MLKYPGFLGAAIFSVAMAVPAMSQDTNADTVLATVGGTEITLGHVIVLRDGLPSEYQNLEDSVLFNGIIDQLVQQAVLAQTIAESTRVIDLKLANERRSLMAGQALGLAIASAVSEEKITAAYDEKYSGFEPDKEYNASHILVETEDEAKALIDDLTAGADFADLAKEHSTGPSGPNGGELGWFSAGMMVQPFQDAVFTMEDGGISAPVQTQFGWHVIKLNESRFQDAPGLEEVRGEIAQQLQDDAVDKTIADLMDAADIVRTDLTEFDPAAMRDLSLVEN